VKIKISRNFFNDRVFGLWRGVKKEIIITAAATSPAGMLRKT